MRVYSARDGIAKAYHVRFGSGWDVVWIERGHYDNCQQIWDGNMLGEIRAAVDSLPAPQRAWALWCYTDIANGAERDVLERAILVELIERYDQRPAIEFPKLGSMLPASSLLYCAMEDSRVRERSGVPGLRLADIARRANIDAHDMYPGRRWRVFFDAIQRHVDDVIAETLGPVAEVVDRINERRAA